MLRERGPHPPRLIFYGISLICLCVVMFMLGSTMTLWTMQFSLDPAHHVVLEGFSLPATLPDATPAMPVTPSPETSPDAKRDVNEHDVLRPPNTAG